MPLTFHQAAFDLAAKSPRVSARAVKILVERERLLGLRFPASVTEFYALTGAPKLLEENSRGDWVVPVEKLGDPEDVTHGVLKFQDENQGVVAWYVRLDGSDDPPVVVLLEDPSPPLPEDDQEWWDRVALEPVAESFSAYVYERVLTGGDRCDRKAVASLKRYRCLVAFNAQNRAEDIVFDSGVHYVNGVPQLPRTLDLAAMRHLRQLDQLRCIRFRSEEVEGSTWAVLRDHPGLVRVEDQGSINDTAVEHLIAMPCLRELVFCDERLTDRGVDLLLRGHQFNRLDIQISKPHTARSLVALGAQVELNRLSLTVHDSEMADDAMAGLAGLESLKELTIASERVSDNALRHLATLSGLERLELFYLRQITDEALGHLAGLTSLTYLRIAHCEGISGDGLRQLSGLSNLRELHLRGLPIQDESLVHLSGLTSLVKLDLGNTSVVGSGLRHLSGLSKLRELDLQENATVDEGLRHLASMPALDWLNVAHSKITDAGLMELAPLRKLAYLCLDGTSISIEAIRALRDAHAR